MIFVVLFTIAKLWNHLTCPKNNKWIKKIWYTYIHIFVYHETLLSNKEKWSYVICRKMGETAYHHVKPSPKNQITQVFSHLWNVNLQWLWDNNDGRALVAHTCNPCYLRSWDGVDCGSRQIVRETPSPK
jgi:hypothetical protein